MWRLQQLQRPLDRFSHRFHHIPLFSLLDSFQPLPSPLQSWSLPLTPIPPSLLCSAWRCRLLSPPCPSHPLGTSPMYRNFGFRPAGPQFTPPSRSPLMLLSLLPPSPPSPPPPSLASIPFQPYISTLIPYPHLHRPSGSCIRPLRPSRLLPRPRRKILPVRNKMFVTEQAGVRHAGRLWAGQPRAESSLAAPSQWWGTASTVTFSYTVHTVSPCALLAGVPALTLPSRQACGGSGQVPDAKAAPLDRLANLSDIWTTYLRNYNNPP